MGPPGREKSDTEAGWLDEIAGLLCAADGQDLAPERVLLARYRGDAGLHPGRSVVRNSPLGEAAVRVDLGR